MRRFVAIGLAIAALPAMTVASDEAPLSRDRQAVLDRQIGHLTPSGEERCISRRRIRDTYVISDQRILYRMSRNLVYENRLATSCPGMARSPHMPQAARIDAAMLCAGDTLTVADDGGASCSLGRFTVWRPAAGN